MPWDFGVSDVANLPTSETNTGKVLAPDGSGGLVWVTASAGVTDHGALTGLADDDHPQYHNDARALTWHSALPGAHVTGGDAHDHVGGDGAQIAHGGLSGLSSDDHTGYLLATGARTGASSQAQAFTNGIIGPSWKPSANGTTALQMQKADGTNVLNVDTTNGRVGIGTNAPTKLLDVAGDVRLRSHLFLESQSTIFTVDDLWGHGIYIKNASGNQIAYFNPQFRNISLGDAAFGSSATIAAKGTGNFPVLLLQAYSGQTVDLVQIYNKNSQRAYQLTSEDVHNFLGDMNVGGRVSSAPSFNRLSGATTRYTCSAANYSAVNLNVLFDNSHNAAAFMCNTGVEGSVEVNFNPYIGWTPNTNTGFTYAAGIIYVNFWSGMEAKNISVDAYYPNAGTDHWWNNMANIPNNSGTKAVLSVSGNYWKKIRFRFSHPTHDVWVNGISYFPLSPENISEMTTAPRFASERLKMAHQGADWYDTTWTKRHWVDYPVANGATAVAYMYDTTNNLSTAGALLASWRNQGTQKMSIDKDGQIAPVGGISLSATNIVTDTTTGMKLGTDTGQKIGVWNATPVARPSAYTQTYATADKTLAAYTADTESSAYTGIDNAQGGTPYAQLTDLNALRVAYENLRAFTEDLAQFVNAQVDDMQTIGWFA